MPGFKLLKTGSGIEPIIWMSLSGLLLLGIASTLIDLNQLPTQQMQLANGNGQRAVIDVATGTVSLTLYKAKEAAFDVSDTEPAPETPAPPEVKTEEFVDETPAPEPAKPAEGIVPLRTTPLPTALPQVESSSETLVPVPAPEVSEKKGDGFLPKRNGEVTPAKIYARKFTRTPEQHLLSVVILDAGLSAQSLPILMTLPKETTLAFSPYAPDAQARIATVRKAGYEVWGMLPTQGTRYPQDDPGPLGLTSTLPKDEMLRRLFAVLQTTLGSVGVVLSPDDALSAKGEAFSPVMAEIDGRGLNVLTTSAARTANQVAGAQKLQSTVLRADSILDPVPDEAAIEKKLAELSETLKTKESVVIVASARPQTLLALQKWFREQKLEAPAVLAPLSAHWLPKEAPPPPEPEEKKSGGGH